MDDPKKNLGHGLGSIHQLLILRKGRGLSGQNDWRSPTPERSLLFDTEDENIFIKNYKVKKKKTHMHG